jgi:hypothetical protein
LNRVALRLNISSRDRSKFKNRLVTGKVEVLYRICVIDPLFKGEVVKTFQANNTFLVFAHNHFFPQIIGHVVVKIVLTLAYAAYWLNWASRAFLLIALDARHLHHLAGLQNSFLSLVLQARDQQ